MSETQSRSRVGDLLKRLFAIDLRALGIFRILLAVVILIDYAGRLPDLDAHYTEAGVMPMASAKLFHATSLWLLVSPYSWNGTHDWSLSLIILSLFAALFLFLGWQTRLATIVSWFLMIGLHTRYPLVLEGYDVYLRQMLFWSMFLPLGARYSVDGLAAEHLAHRLPLPRFTLSVASTALLLEVGCVYWFNAIAKSSPQWRSEFTALYYALSLHAFTTPVGQFLRDQVRWILAPFTAGTFFLEAFGPFVAFLPVATAKIRPYVVAVFIAFHLLGIGIFMDVGAFHYVASLPWLLFLPGSFWDGMERRVNRFSLTPVGERLTALVDPVIAWRNQRIDRRIRQGAPVPRLTSTFWEDFRSLRSGSFSTGFPGFFRLLIAEIVAVFCLLFVLQWNIRTTNLPWAQQWIPPARMEVVWLTRLDQFWGMFSPKPMPVDLWIVIPALTLDNTLFDLYKMRSPVNYSRPSSVHKFYKNTRWRKYLTNIYDSQWANQRGYYCQWLAREWNQTHQGPQALLGFWFCAVEAETLPNYQQPKPVLRVLHQYWSIVPRTPVNALPPEVPAELLPTPSLTQGAAPHGANRSSQSEKNIQKR